MYLADDEFHVDAPFLEVPDKIIVALLRRDLLGPEVPRPRAGTHTDDVDEDQMEVVDKILK